MWSLCFIRNFYKGKKQTLSILSSAKVLYRSKRLQNNLTMTMKPWIYIWIWSMSTIQKVRNWLKCPGLGWFRPMPALKVLKLSIHEKVFYQPFETWGVFSFCIFVAFFLTTMQLKTPDMHSTSCLKSCEMPNKFILVYSFFTNF